MGTNRSTHSGRKRNRYEMDSVSDNQSYRSKRFKYEHRHTVLRPEDDEMERLRLEKEYGNLDWKDCCLQILDKIFEDAGSL